MKTSPLLLSLLCALSFPAAFAAGPAPTQKNPCARLAALKLPEVRITTAAFAAAGTPHCRVLGVIGKETKFELLLPEKWNGIFVMGGGGGFVGTIQNSARYALDSGYATAGTDTGHDNSSTMSAGWALGNAERKLNFAYLAVHRTVLVSRALIEAFYGRPAGYSYFLGCSRGGGQGMTEAQRYPGDFDGIVAGAPAFNWPGLAAKFIQDTRAVYPSGLTGEPLISTAALRVLQQAVLDKCDGIDGTRDGILEDPSKCGFSLEDLPRCSGDGAEKDCFTEARLKALREIYGGFRSGKIFYPGYPFGAEGEPDGWQAWISGPNEGLLKKSGYPSLQAYFGIEMFKYMILDDPAWNYAETGQDWPEKRMLEAAAAFDSVSPDYAGFKGRRGRMILWHGWNDPAISAYATIAHYEAVKAADPAADGYMRLFLLPGVLHCGGGPGPSQADWLALIRKWVEKGEAPGRVEVSKASDGKGAAARTVFPYGTDTAQRPPDGKKGATP